MKRIYEVAEIRITLFEEESVITASTVYSVESQEPDDLPILPMV